MSLKTFLDAPAALAWGVTRFSLEQKKKPPLS
jgi:hypothetical protein